MLKVEQVCCVLFKVFSSLVMCCDNSAAAMSKQKGDTSTLRAFCPGYFPHFASGLEPRHIGVRPKGTPFGLGCYPKP